MEIAQEGRAGISGGVGTTFQGRDPTAIEPGGTFETRGLVFEGPDRYVDNQDAGFAGRDGDFDIPTGKISVAGNIIVMRHASFVEDIPWFEMSNDDLNRQGKCFEGPPDLGESAGDGFAGRRASTDMGHTGFDGCPMSFDMSRRVPDGPNMRIVAWSWHLTT